MARKYVHVWPINWILSLSPFSLIFWLRAIDSSNVDRLFRCCCLFFFCLVLSFFIFYQNKFVPILSSGRVHWTLMMIIRHGMGAKWSSTQTNGLPTIIIAHLYWLCSKKKWDEKTVVFRSKNIVRLLLCSLVALS